MQRAHSATELHTQPLAHFLRDSFGCCLNTDLGKAEAIGDQLAVDGIRARIGSPCVSARHMAGNSWTVFHLRAKMARFLLVQWIQIWERKKEGKDYWEDLGVVS